MAKKKDKPGDPMYEGGLKIRPKTEKEGGKKRKKKSKSKKKSKK